MNNKGFSSRFSENFEFFKRSTYQLFILYFGFLGLFFIYRLIHFFINGNSALTTDISAGDFVTAFLTGSRFDTMVIFYGFLPLMLFSVAGLFINLQNRKFYWKFFRYYSVFLAFLYTFLLVVDIYFYQYFHSHVNILIFAFFEDDTSALIHTFWNDFPVISIILGLLFIIALFSFITQRIARKNIKISIQRKRFKTAYILVILSVYFVGMRGSVSGYPLRMDNADITNDPFINSLACNGIYALKDAVSEYNASNISTNFQSTLKQFGYKSIEDLAAQYRGLMSNNDSNKTDFPNPFMSTTEINPFLEANPPNVIFILAESMGAHPLTFHDHDTFNLLGTLEEELPHCLVFDHFWGSTPSTIGSLEYIMIGNTQSPLAQSSYRTIPLSSSVALPYKKAGYETSFMTGSKLSWRKIGNYIKHQYFDEVIGYAGLKKIIPQQNEFHQYGSYDEYLYEAILQKLKDSAKPQFIFALTVANHPPFTIPSHYKKLPLILPDSLKRQTSASEPYLIRCFTAFQYANSELGKFIHQIRTSPMGANTIIAVTGDHNIRRIFNYSDAQLLQKYGVSFILYIPDKYKKALGYNNVNTSCFGSHKDIFPTLFHSSLSGVKYFKTGNNLLLSESLSDGFAVFGQSSFMGPQGCVYIKNENPHFFTWADDDKTSLVPYNTTTETSELQALMKKGLLQFAAIRVALQKELSEKSKTKKFID